MNKKRNSLTEVISVPSNRYTVWKRSFAFTPYAGKAPRNILIFSIYDINERGEKFNKYSTTHKEEDDKITYLLEWYIHGVDLFDRPWCKLVDEANQATASLSTKILNILS